MIYLNNFLFDFIQIWCIILSESYVVPSWSCVGLVILTKVSHLQFSGCDFLFFYFSIKSICVTSPHSSHCKNSFEITPFSSCSLSVTLNFLLLQFGHIFVFPRFYQVFPTEPFLPYPSITSHIFPYPGKQNE